MSPENGSKVMSDGIIVKKDGTKMIMKERQHMDMSGNITNAITKKIFQKNDSKEK